MRRAPFLFWCGLISTKVTSAFLIGNVTNELVRHFLIESSAKGVHVKGASEEPHFGKSEYGLTVFFYSTWY